MKGFAVIMVLVLLSAAPWFLGEARATGGLDFDSTTDVLSCGSFGFSTVLDSINIIAWVTPNFAHTSVVDSVIISNYDGTFNTEASTGFILYWDGSVTAFVLRGSNDLEVFGPDWFDSDCTMDQFGDGGQPSFAAGDLVGLMFSLQDDIQACEAITPHTGLSATAFKFFDFGYTGVGGAVNIGADFTGGDQWNGGIHQLVLMDTRVLTLNNNTLRATRKLLFYPQIPVLAADATIPLYVAAWNFGPAPIGVSLASGNTMVDVSGNGHDCTVDAGATPIGIGTEMLH